MGGEECEGGVAFAVGHGGEDGKRKPPLEGVIGRKVEECGGEPK